MLHRLAAKPEQHLASAGTGQLRPDTAGTGHLRPDTAGTGHLRLGTAGTGHLRLGTAGTGHLRLGTAGTGGIAGIGPQVAGAFQRRTLTALVGSSNSGSALAKRGGAGGPLNKELLS